MTDYEVYKLQLFGYLGLVGSIVCFIGSIVALATNPPAWLFVTAFVLIHLSPLSSIGFRLFLSSIPKLLPKTSLYSAVEQGCFNTVTHLLTSGANVNALNKGMKRAIDIAAEKGHTGIVEKLLEAGSVIPEHYLTELHLSDLFVCSSTNKKLSENDIKKINNITTLFKEYNNYKKNYEQSANYNSRLSLKEQYSKGRKMLQGDLEKTPYNERSIYVEKNSGLTAPSLHFTNSNIVEATVVPVVYPYTHHQTNTHDQTSVLRVF